MNGDEMNSASIPMNLTATPAAPTTTAASAAVGALQALDGTGGFDQALADAQGEQPLALEAVSVLLANAVVPHESADPLAGAAAEDGDIDPEAEEIAGADAAAILAQMLLGTSQAARTDAPPPVDAGLQAAARPANALVMGSAGARDPNSNGEEGTVSGGEGDENDPAAGASSPLDLATKDTQSLPGTSALLKLSSELPAPNTQSAQSAPPTVNTAQAAVQAAASALRDSAPITAAPTPVHAALREPVGTARWADELGNRLVLMSVRGQQQGSLSLTPEHLGPVEVQISVNRDTANVWFGAAHADTRAALAEAMPRLRELLASSGLSLGQSGVSEQAPRESFATPGPHAGSGSTAPDADPAGVSAPAWRLWRPGLIDTYA
jgi:flagellar hook-length control protein FliK